MSGINLIISLKFTDIWKRTEFLTTVTTVKVSSACTKSEQPVAADDKPAAKTFTVGFEDNKYNEIPYAEEFSKSINAENISKIISADEYFEKIQKESLHLGHLKGEEKDIALKKYYNYKGNSKGIYF